MLKLQFGELKEHRLKVEQDVLKIANTDPEFLKTVINGEIWQIYRAANDGYLQVLKEATKRDCNHPDEDGFTPTLCAAYQGNLDALKLLLIRGGDPEKCDHYGNTSLHCAAARGHMNCASYLVNFGVNIWALDNEFHTAKDLAAIHNRQEILRFLDIEATKQEKENPKKARKLQEKAPKDAEKRLKEFDKIQRKTDKKRQEEEEKLQKEREKINNLENANHGTQKRGIFNSISKSPFALITSNKLEPKVIHSKSVHSAAKFSELTQDSNKKALSGIQNQLLKKKFHNEKSKNEFKVRTTATDGKESVKNLSGLQRDSEIIFVPTGTLNSTENLTQSCAKRGKIPDEFKSGMLPVIPSDLNQAIGSPEIGEPQFCPHQSSIFDRPGFGSVAFRKSLTANLGMIQHTPSNESECCGHPSEENGKVSLDSHGSSQLSRLTPWEEEDLPSEDENESTPIFVFLVSCGLERYTPIFTNEQIDLDALMLLNDQDLEGLNIPLGPRRKLLRALNDRRLALDDPGEVIDIRL